jgi:hypothetical protein
METLTLLYNKLITIKLENGDSFIVREGNKGFLINYKNKWYQLVPSGITEIINKKETKKQFDMFFIHYHKITKLLISDKEPALKYWNRLSLKERRKAYANVKPYLMSLPTYNGTKPIKKARTYLRDKDFNNEFKSSKPKYSTKLPSSKMFK